MYAAHGDHPHCVNELLLRGADFTASNESGDTAYTIVVRNNSHLGKTFSLSAKFLEVLPIISIILGVTFLLQHKQSLRIIFSH